MNITPTDNLNFSGKYALSNYKACLKGGAIGDELGWPVEFMRLNSIKRQYGCKGIQNLVLNNKGKAEITDDTQMTMFTADGLLKNICKTLNLDELPDMNTVFNSYKLWLNTQYGKMIQKGQGWIAEIPGLYENRAPGNTCTSAVRNGIPGSFRKPINNSCGCGGVMRVAPVGLMYKDNPELAFEIGARCAALTHSNPRAYLPAGVMSGMIANIISGDDIPTALDKNMKVLEEYYGNEPVTKLLDDAKKYAKSDMNPEDSIYNLGEGWVGDEALAISVYCALKEPNDFQKAVRMAVNHNGDSDSTGAILGNIMGAHLGIEKLPADWVEKIELTKELDILAEDLFVNPKEIKNPEKRYPISKNNTK